MNRRSDRIRPSAFLRRTGIRMRKQLAKAALLISVIVVAFLLGRGLSPRDEDPIVDSSRPSAAAREKPSPTDEELGGARTESVEGEPVSEATVSGVKVLLRVFTNRGEPLVGAEAAFRYEHCGETDSSGHLEMKLPESSRMSLVSFELDGWYVRLDVPSQIARPGGTYDFTAYAAHFQPIDVMVGRSAWDQECTIVSRTGSARSTHVWSPQKRGIWLRNGDLKVEARANELRSRPCVVDGQEPIKLVLERICAVRVRVEYPEDRVRSRDVILKWRAEAGQEDVKFLPRSSPYLELQLFAGRYWFGASRSWDSGGAEDQVDREIQEDCEVVLALAPWSPEASCEVRVLDPFGEPVEGADFAYGKFGGGMRLQSESLRGGVYLVELAKVTRRPEVLRISCAEWGSMRVECPEVDQEIEARFSDMYGELKVQVVSSSKSVLENQLAQRLRVRLRQLKAREHQELGLSAAGTATFSKVTPAEYWVALFLGPNMVESQEVTVLEREPTTVEFALQVGSVSVRRPSTGRVRLTNECGKIVQAGERATRDDILFEFVAPGDYLLEWIGDSGATASAVTVRAGDALRVEGPGDPHDCLRFCASPLRGLLQQSGLMDGDLILEIDGSIPHAVPDEQGLFQRAYTAECAEFRVLRDGAEFLISVSAVGAQEPPRTFGGQLIRWRRGG